MRSRVVAGAREIACAHPMEPAETFDHDRAETIRVRLRWTLPAAVVVLVASWIFVDDAAFTRAQATAIRAPEIVASMAAWWWLRRARSARAVEAAALATWFVVAACAAYGLRIVPEAMLATKVAGHVISALVVCVILSLGWRATLGIAAMTSTVLATVSLRGADALVKVTLTATGFAFGVVVFAAAARDRSKRAEIAARLALVAANARLARDDELRRRLFVNLSHDLRTPLAVVRGEAATLRASGRYGDDDASLFRIEANAQALADLADQLLDLARLDAGQLPVRKARCDVGQLARDVAALFDAPGKSIATRVATDAIAHADPAHVRRIFANLVANARRHSDDVAIDVRREGDRVVADVVDGGPGVAPDRRAAIFERFVSFDSDGSTAAGIGVPLARELAVQNGGALDLVDAPKTTFRLVLPATDGPADDVEAPPRIVAPREREPAANASAPSLLVVEDNADMAATLRRVLSPSFDVVHVARVRDAIARLDDAPAGVLCDVLLPDGTGYDVLASARARRDSPPVVLVSALGSVDERVRGLAAGADDYVPKPFAPDELVERVRSAIRRADARRRGLEAQRDALLMEVHDGVSASLARAAMILGRAPTKESIGFASAAIADGLDEVRAITRLMSPRATAWRALAADVRRATSDACAAAGLSLDFEADDADAVVPPAIAHALRRVAREATTNAVKHAAARALRCRMRVTPERFELCVHDDGRGIGKDGDGQGLGVMRRRVERVGGAVAIAAREGGGTSVTATIPRVPHDHAMAAGAPAP